MLVDFDYDPGQKSPMGHPDNACENIPASVEVNHIELTEESRKEVEAAILERRDG